MQFDFDKPVSRRHTNSLKWDMKQGDLLPMWVADMDFESPVEIRDALAQQTENNVFGYAWPPDELYEVIADRLKTRHGWQIEKEWIVLLSGLVPGIHAAARILEPHRADIMTATPVYYHLFKAAETIGNRTIEIPFVKTTSRWEMDFEKMYAQLGKNTGMYMLCNPHNPNGRVFDKIELQKLVDFCLENELILVSDEIHCDLILDESCTHITAASLNKAIEQQSITLMAPSKTFNIAGIGGSFAIIPNESIRKRFEQAIFGIMPHFSNMAIASMIAAYRYGEPWRKALIAYLNANHDFLLQEINQIEGLKMEPLEATYLAWISCEHTDAEAYIATKGMAVSGAQQFHGHGHFRLNFGTQRAHLEEAVAILKKAFN